MPQQTQAPDPRQIPVFDNHTHLEIADGSNPMDYREHLDRASSVGVRGVIQVGGDLVTSRWSAEVATREPRVLAAVALHPNEVAGYVASGTLDEALAEIDELAARPRVAAIGTSVTAGPTPRPSSQQIAPVSIPGRIDFASRLNTSVTVTAPMMLPKNSPMSMSPSSSS